MLKNFIKPTLLASAILTGFCGSAAQAASHREAPLMALDPTADITDVYAFRSWENPGNVVFIMNVIPGQEPSSGPNYFNFDDEVAYDINLDVNQDGKADDIIYRIQFKTEIRPPFNDLPVAYAGVDGIAGLPGSIRSLTGPDSAGLGLRQKYTVTEIRGRNSRVLNKDFMFAVPSNIGPRTIADYEDLTERGIYDLKNGGRIYAGQRDETFYIDLGSVFDTLNFRAPPILTDVQDANDGVNSFGNDMFSGFNVNTIAIEIPISQVLKDPNNKVIGMYASTSRPQFKFLGGGKPRTRGGYVQVSRMANPLVNELIIGTGSKDRWNATDPENEKQFLDFYLKPRLAGILNLAFGTKFPTSDRTDLVAALLKYPGQNASLCNSNNICSELLRLDTGVQPTLPAGQKRLAVLAGDPAGFPNGRRPNDDVTDIALRVVAGALLGKVPNLGDGVNFNIGAPGSNLTSNGIYTQFPFLPTAHDGRNRQHIDCGELGANPCN